MARPLIGVTGPDRHGEPAWWCTRIGLWLAGGRARRITPRRRHGLDGVEGLDGLIIGGGADVSPELYGQPHLTFDDLRAQMRSPRRTRPERLLGLLFLPVILALRLLSSRKGSKGRTDAGRDDLETDLLRLALDADLPVLGICRGAQLLNVHRGGTLHQALVDFYEETPQLRTLLPAKRVRLEPDSRLAAILGNEECWVNALHDQAIDAPGEGLRIVAREETGVVQAIEDPGHPFRIGVQWHPEYLSWVRRQRRLLRAFVRACSGLDPVS